MSSHGLEDVWRRESPHVLGALLRRHGDLGDCEDAAQEALVAAARQWARDGVPENPRGWLIRVASRRLIDEDTRADRARRSPRGGAWRGAPTRLHRRRGRPTADGRRQLQLLLLCCHPALTRPRRSR